MLRSLLRHSDFNKKFRRFQKAFESISNKCYDLYQGPDGISKT